MLIPVLLGAGGGCAVASVLRILFGEDMLTPGKYKKLMVEQNELQCRLNKLKVELETKGVDIDKLKRQLEKLKN